MRFLVRATIPVEAGNALVGDPNFGKVMEDILSDLKPEAVYYCAEQGQRTIYFRRGPCGDPPDIRDSRAALAILESEYRGHAGHESGRVHQSSAGHFASRGEILIRQEYCPAALRSSGRCSREFGTCIPNSESLSFATEHPTL